MDVPRVDHEKLACNRTVESSEAVRQRVLCARKKQLDRFDGSGLSCNADAPALAAHALPATLRSKRSEDGSSAKPPVGLHPPEACVRAGRGASVDPAHIREYCELDDTSKALMHSTMNQLGMSARAFHRVLKVARTIADLAGQSRFKPCTLRGLRRSTFGRPRRQG